MKTYASLCLLLISIFCFCEGSGSVLSGQEMKNCEGSITLHMESGEPRTISKLEILERDGELEERVYVEHGAKEGTCCFRLRGRRSKYTDIRGSGQHAVKMSIGKIEIIDCVLEANLVYPVLGAAAALVLVVLAAVLIVRWRRRRGQLPVPTQEEEA